MHVEPRNGAPIIQIVVHVNVGPEVEGGAASLAGYLPRIDGGYHSVVDDKTEIIMAADSWIVWGASGANTHGVHLCFIGSADQTAEQWLDAYSRGELNIGAARVATWCKTYGIPVVHLTPQQVHDQAHGIAGHVDVEVSGLPGTGGASGHYDPSRHNFPWDLFLGLVNLALGHPTPLPIPVKEDLMTTIAIAKGGGTARPVPGFGGVLLENGARLLGDTAVKGSTSHFWRHKDVPANATLVDITDYRAIGEANTIAALYDLHDNKPLHPYRATIAS